MQELSTLQELVQEKFSLATRESLSREALEALLANKIRELINSRMQELIRLLYQVDVDEAKLRKALDTCDADAGLIIARMVIERQLEKIQSRIKYGTNSHPPFTGEEKW